ncbi:hypothetical protein [Microbacterium sp. CIAB417]|uniref:hypothetical protein n=1 Tax=Microbacterium sp. CIAB417 TaxID=2860287 RepID=UPI001FAC1152|nr:hypothetical protein [Microbacterium sp. CIAB417]
MSIVAPTDPPSPATPAWEIVPLGHTGWRICDATRGHTDPSRMVAYAEKSEIGAIEVLWLRSPCPNRSRYRDLDELLADLDAAVAAAEVDRSTRPFEIPHFPPEK